MPHIRRIGNETEIDVSKKWNDITNFKSKGKIVEFEGHKYKIVCKKEHKYSCAQRFMRIVLAIIAVLITCGFALCVKETRELFTYDKKVVRYGVLQPQLDLKKIQDVFNNYTTTPHPGLTLVMGHPFSDATFRIRVEDEQNAIKQVFKDHALEELLLLYDAQTQVHATLIELATQHDKERVDQRLLNENELEISHKTKQPININYAVTWINKTQPFEVELGDNVLSEKNRDQTLRITETGQIVMKGRAKERKLISDMRAEFEKEAGIIHKYGKEDDEFFFVIGFVKPDKRLLDPSFRKDLEKCINQRRPLIKLALRVDRVKIILYQNYSLDKNACLWESKEYNLSEKTDIPNDNLVDLVKTLIREKRPIFGPENSTKP